MTLSIPLMAAAVALAPVAHAGMPYGNYEVQTPRDPGHSWLWDSPAVRARSPRGLHPRDQAQPRPNGQATPWYAVAHLANGRYTMIVDVPDGVRCTVYFLPSHDTYTWDAVTLTGSVDSTFDAGCGGAPGGTASLAVQPRPVLRSRRSAGGQSKHSLGDDVALDFRGAAGDGAREAAGVALEPAAEVVVEVHRLVRSGQRRVQ